MEQLLNLSIIRHTFNALRMTAFFSHLAMYKISIQQSHKRQCSFSGVASFLQNLDRVGEICFAYIITSRLCGPFLMPDILWISLVNITILHFFCFLVLHISWSNLWMPIDFDQNYWKVAIFVCEVYRPQLHLLCTSLCNLQQRIYFSSPVI